MAEIKKISTEFQLLDKFLDTGGSAGSSGSVLTSTSTGTSWVSAGTPGTGVYLPLAGGTMNSNASINMNSGQFTSVDYIDFGIGQLNGESTSNFILKSLGDITYNVDSNNNGNSAHIFQESGVELMRIRYDGNVGIGTTSPSAKLQVGENTSGLTGTTSIFQEGGAEVGLYVKARVNRASLLVADNDTGVYISAEGGMGSFGRTQGVSTANINIDGSGNVGIGTTSPGSKLEVSSGPGANGDCILTVSADTDNSTATSNPKLLMLQKGSTKTSLIEMDSSNRTHFSNQDGYYFSGGNVGIGTTSPTNPLHVHTDTDDDYAIRIEGSTNNVAGVWTGLGIGGEANNTKSAILFEDVGVSYSRGKLHLCVNNAADQTNATTADAKLTVSNDGNVGIGTTSPGRPLSVNSDTSHKAIRILENDSGNESWDIGVDAEGDLNFFNSADTSPTVSFLDNGNATFAGTLTVDGSLNLDLDLDVGATATFNDQTFFYDDLNISGGIIDSDTTITATNFILSSDERLKENVKKVCDNRVKVDWKTFELKTEKGQKRYGVIAQELEKTNPEFVRENNQGFKSVAYIDLLIAKIAELEARLEKLEK